jgi:hypothetical protein
MRHRRSISVIVYLLAGGVIAYKTRVQPVLSTTGSSTEAEFVAPCDAGKVALYLTFCSGHMLSRFGSAGQATSNRRPGVQDFHISCVFRTTYGDEIARPLACFLRAAKLVVEAAARV